MLNNAFKFVDLNAVDAARTKPVHRSKYNIESYAALLQIKVCTGQEGYGRNLGDITQSHMLSFPNVYPVCS